MREDSPACSRAEPSAAGVTYHQSLWVTAGDATEQQTLTQRRSSVALMIKSIYLKVWNSHDVILVPAMIVTMQVQVLRQHIHL